MPAKQKNCRILIIDDNEAVHKDFRRILPTVPPDETLDELAGELFGAPPPTSRDNLQSSYEITSAYSGEEGLKQAGRAVQAGTPFAVAFVDVRMPAGWSGVETARRLWEVMPSLQIVLCSAYSDYSWGQIAARLGLSDRFLILKKPFEPIEVCQLACALVEKWHLQAELTEASRGLAAQFAATSALLAAIPDLILRIDTDGICVEVKPSPTLPAFLRRGVELPAELSRLVPEGVAEALLDGARRAIASGAVQVFELEDLLMDGVAHAIEARAVRNGGAEAVVLLRDVTEQKHLAKNAVARMRQEQLVAAHTATLAALSAPLIPITDNVVVMPLVGELDAVRSARVREALIRGVATSRAKVAIVDVTGVPSMDGATAEEFLRWASAVRLLGTELILTGIGPEVSRAMVLHGTDLRGVETHQNLQSGVAFALKRTTARRRRS